MKIFKYIILLLIVGFVFFMFNNHKDTTLIKGNTPSYTGSNSCKTCHTSTHNSWNNSLHPKIFKKYTSDSQIVADFINKPDFVEFNKSDVEVIIGGKWEQVFARKINDDYYPFPAKWMVLTQEWVPYRLDDWNHTALNQKCNGCHTVGLNEETKEFVEWGVGCESCHGPGSTHIQNKKLLTDNKCIACHSSTLVSKLNKQEDIIVSEKSAVCGQCHSRGKQTVIDKYHTQVQFNFPLEYLPGQNISKDFKATNLESDKKGKNWWGNGVSKNRHQEYADFAKSNHANSLKNLKEKKSEFCAEQPKDSCLKCHSADYMFAKEGEKPTLETAKLGITCISCHNPHSLGNKKDEKYKISDGCGNCHISNLAKRTALSSKEHYPCPTNEVSCADCHMPRIVKTGGKFSLRSHAFKIIPPEATEKYNMPNSCQNGSCHQDKSLDWAKINYKEFYLDKDKTLSEIVREK